MIPVPFGAGFIITLALPHTPIASCGIVLASTSDTLTKFLLAACNPFLIASGTSLALPVPIPTNPFPSPTTLVSSSSVELKIKNGGNAEGAKLVGADVAKKAKKAGITKVVFDRGGYQYHGRVEALAEAAREAGLEF